MKKNIENSIKESLNGHELPYNSSAWDALSSKLDTVATPSGDASSVDGAIKSSLENYELPYAASAWTALNAKLDSNPTPGVDQAVKSSLENYELPYAAGAWTALNAKLDAKAAPRSNTKWYVAASVLIAAAAVSYFVINGSTEEDNSSTQATEIAQNRNTAAPSTTNNSTSTSNGTTVENNDNNSNVIPPITGEDPSNTIVEPIINAGNNNIAAGNDNGSGNDNGNGNSQIEGSDNLAGNTPSNNTPDPIVGNPSVEPFIMPALNDVCQGASIKVSNANKYNISVLYPNGSVWSGRSESETTLTTSIAGTYLVGYMVDDQFEEAGSFIVHPAPAADFDFIDLDEILLEGLPTTEVKSMTPGIKYEWKFGKETTTGSEASPHFFTKGNHEIELTVTGSNGCESTVTKTVNIEENYNLLATTGFDPKSLNTKNNTFIPQALLERDVNFTMIIIDINDGHVMYETSDASQGWDGIDRATGNLIEYQKPFIWKVTLENSEAGERSVYGGSGVAIPKTN